MISEAIKEVALWFGAYTMTFVVSLALLWCMDCTIVPAMQGWLENN